LGVIGKVTQSGTEIMPASRAADLDEFTFNYVEGHEVVWWQMEFPSLYAITEVTLSQRIPAAEKTAISRGKMEGTLS